MDKVSRITQLKKLCAINLTGGMTREEFIKMNEDRCLVVYERPNQLVAYEKGLFSLIYFGSFHLGVSNRIEIIS